MWGVVPGRRGYRRRSETGVEPGAPAAQRDGCRDSSDAGEPAVLTTMSAAMHRYVEVVKQYPGQQQVDLAVEIEVPGSWFGAGPMGALADAERREKYTAQAVEYAEVREFPGASRTARCTQHNLGPQILSDYAFTTTEQVRLASTDTRDDCRCLHEALRQRVALVGIESDVSS